MEQNYQSTKLPTVGASSAIGGAAAWSNPSRITADDGSSASWGAFLGGQMSLITGSSFGFQQLPSSAVIDGIAVFVDGSQTGCYGNVTLNITGTTGKAIGAFGGYGGSTDLWGATSIDPADIAGISVSVEANDVSGGDGIASIDYISITVFWHIEMPQVTDNDVPTRLAYKVYSRSGTYLGELPNVSSKFAFSQDMNSAGSSIQIVCGKYIDNETTVDPLLTEAEDVIQTENDLDLLATATNVIVALGNSPDEVMFKNSNRIKVWMYNKWYPNGKLMFSGQVNKVSFQYGGGDSSVAMLVYSDGLDLDNFIARGYPFAYTTDQSQTAQDTWDYIIQYPVGGGWHRTGQTFRTGGAVTNIGAISLLLNWSATVTVRVYDGPNGNMLGQTTQVVSNAVPTVVQFEFPQLIPVSPSTDYFFDISVAEGQTIVVQYNSTSVYANGTRYISDYAGGSGGGSFTPDTGDLYFITKSGLPTTTATYTSDDPVTDMMAGILTDYNNRGGLITEGDFVAAGLSITYTFVVATIFDALKKILELSPTGYYSYIDLGLATLDIKQISSTADFTVVRGKDVNQLTIAMSIEQVKNYLLLSGGEVSPGVNLYRDYQNSVSTTNYGIRTVPKSDNRITLDATADAIGDSFIDENSEETQETSVTVLGEVMDITLLTPGVTIGFRNFGSFVDDMVLQVVRRSFTPEAVTLTLGRLPITQSAQVQNLQRQLILEQTVNNPSNPTW